MRKVVKKTIEDHYMSFILITTASLALIAAVVWGVTVAVRMMKSK